MVMPKGYIVSLSATREIAAVAIAPSQRRLLILGRTKDLVHFTKQILPFGL